MLSIDPLGYLKNMRQCAVFVLYTYISFVLGKDRWTFGFELSTGKGKRECMPSLFFLPDKGLVERQRPCILWIR